MKSHVARCIGLVALASTSACPLPRLYVVDAGPADATIDVTRSEAAVLDAGDSGLCGNDTCDPGESPCGCPSDCAPAESDVQTLTAVNDWHDYGPPYVSLRCAIDAAGLVHLSGVVTYRPSSPAPPTAMSLIANLPMGCKPRDQSLEFSAVMGTVAATASDPSPSGVGAVVIATSGALYWASPPQSGSSLGEPNFTSLDGIVYVGDGSHLPQPTPLAPLLLSGWTSATASATSGPAGYYVDPSGEVHLTGSVIHMGLTPTPGATETIFRPDSMQLPSNRLVFDAFAVASGMTGRVGARIDVDHGAVTWHSSASGSDLRVSLDGISFRGMPYNVVWTRATTMGSWSDSIAGMTDAGEVYLGNRTDCLGVVHGRGRAVAGDGGVLAPSDAGVAITMFNPGPNSGRRIFPALSGPTDVGGRLDVGTDGTVYWMAGDTAVNDYISFANITYIP